MEIKLCKACNSGQLKRFLELGNIPPVNAFIDETQIVNEKSYPLNLSYCKSCLLVQLEDVVDPSELFSNYLHLSSASDSNIGHLKEFAQEIHQKCNLNKETKILEIGSNDGTLLAFLKNYTNNVLGIDPAKNLASLSANNGVETLPLFFNIDTAENILNTRGKFDFIIALNVIPHTPQVVDLLKGVKKILNKNGMLIMEGAYALETILKGEFDTIYHEHVYCFSLHSLISTFKLAGLKVVDVEKIPTQGGSLRIFAQEENTQNYPSQSVLNMLSEEKLIGLTDSKIYDSIEQKVKKFREDFKELIKIEKIKTGNPLIGIGAPARGVVILNYCGINSDDLEYVIDDTPLKQEKVMPGVHIPVKSWDSLNEKNKQSFILLSWNYKLHLIEKLKKHTSTGNIIIPFPRLGVESLG